MRLHAWRTSTSSCQSLCTIKFSSQQSIFEPGTSEIPLSQDDWSVWTLKYTENYLSEENGVISVWMSSPRVRINDDIAAEKNWSWPVSPEMLKEQDYGIQQNETVGLCTWNQNYELLHVKTTHCKQSWSKRDCRPPLGSSTELRYSGLLHSE